MLLSCILHNICLKKSEVRAFPYFNGFLVFRHHGLLERLTQTIMVSFETHEMLSENW